MAIFNTKYQILLKNGYEAKHNMNCWKQEEYIGFGVAAHSYVDNVRYQNTHNIKEYIEFFLSEEKIVEEKKEVLSISNGKYIETMKEIDISKNIGKLVTIHEKQNKLDKEKEYMLLGLRQIKGISIQKFKQKFIENPLYLFRKELNKLVEKELIEVEDDNIKLTNKGLDLANLVWEEFV